MDSPVHLVHILPSNRWGGIERYALDICSHYKELGWEVEAVTRDARAVDNLFQKAGINLRHAPLWGTLDFRSLRLLYKIIKENSHKNIIFHAHGFRKALSAIIAKKISGNKNVKVIITRHKVRKGGDSQLFKLIYKNVDAVIFVSDIARQRFLSTWYNRKKPIIESKLHVIHNSIRREGVSYYEKTEKGPVTALFLGPLVPGKGLETLIDSLAFLRKDKVRLRIVGGGRPDYIDRLRRRALTRNVMDRIDWHKHVDDPLPYIREADFGVAPSQTEEAFGLVNIEYMAAGKPLIASFNGAQPEYITDGREGFLIPPGSASQLAEAIRKLATDAELRKRMGHNAFTTFSEKLAWPLFIKRLSELYSFDAV